MRALMIALSLFAAGSAASAQSLSGRYAVEGTGLDGKAYRGTATITAPSAIDCRIRWEIEGQTAEGTCIRSLNALSAAYPSGDGVVLVIYRLTLDGAMRGDWVVTGQNGAGIEVMTPER